MRQEFALARRQSRVAPKLLTLMIAMLLLLPRMAATYLVYPLVPLLSIDWQRRQPIITMLIIVLFTGAAVFSAYALGMNVSIMAYTIEIALLLPFLMACLGFRMWRWINGRSFIRVVNVAACILSLVSLIERGFPLLLPYVHYAPDYYFAAFGLGGAKIVTVIGFFGIVEAITAPDPLRARIIPSLAAAANFIVPSFLLGFLAGAIALTVFVRRHRKLIIAGVIVALVIGPFLSGRSQQLNSEFEEAFGSHPKIFAYQNVAQVYWEYPVAIFLGAGLGQYGSQPAQWTSPVAEVLSTHSIPELPGLFAGDAHLHYLAPALNRFQDNVWAISSSSNKPYTGYSIALVEMGLPLTIALTYLLYLTLFRKDISGIGRAAFIFHVTINLLDPQLDSPWYGMLLLAILQCRTQERQSLAKADALPPENWTIRG